MKKLGVCLLFMAIIVGVSSSILVAGNWISQGRETLNGMTVRVSKIDWSTLSVWTYNNDRVGWQTVAKRSVLMSPLGNYTTFYFKFGNMVIVSNSRAGWEWKSPHIPIKLQKEGEELLKEAQGKFKTEFK